MTYASSLLPIVDAIRGLITLPTAMEADTSGAAPVKYAPERLYIWPRTQQFIPEGDGSLDLGRFRIRVAWSRAGQGEGMGQVRLPAISTQLDEGVQTVVDMVRANRTSATWESLVVDEVRYDAIVTFDVRAAWIDLSGYRLIT